MAPRVTRGCGADHPITSEARGKEIRRDLGHEGQELLAAAGLCARRDRSACLSADIEAPGRHRAADQDEGTGLGAAKLRISAASHVAETERLGGEPEEALPALPRGLTVRKRGGRKRAIGTNVGDQEGAYR